MFSARKLYNRTNVQNPLIQTSCNNTHDIIDSQESQKQQSTNESDSWYSVNKLLKTKLIKGVRHYLVNWSNPKWPDQWIRGTDITPRLKQLFHANRPTRKRKKRT